VTLLAYLALFGWIPSVVVLFALMPARMVAVTTGIGAWRLLPPSALQAPVYPIIPRAKRRRSSRHALDVLTGLLEAKRRSLKLRRL
jgi:hypothetical protein